MGFARKCATFINKKYAHWLKINLSFVLGELFPDDNVKELYLSNEKYLAQGRQNWNCVFAAKWFQNGKFITLVVLVILFTRKTKIN